MRQAEATIVEHREALAAAEATLATTDVLAPFEGIVVARSIEAGQRVVAGDETPLFPVAADLGIARVRIELAEQEAGKIEVGEVTAIWAASLPGKNFSSVVGGVRRAEAGEEGVSYDVEIDTGDPDQLLKPGMTANVRIDAGARSGSTPRRGGGTTRQG